MARARFGEVLAHSFYERPAEAVARSLLGKVLVHGTTAGRIVETEAYLGVHDAAAHAAAGLTARTRVLFGPPGHAYVYFIYGMYECLNLVAEPDGSPGCVLIRALEPVAGLEEMRRRRGAIRKEEDLANGPGKLTIAMGISRAAHNGCDVTAGPLTVCAGDEADAFRIAVGPRVGITKASDWMLRFAIAGNRYVSKPRLPDVEGA
ncbi:MAG: DNA-3-methyladenine glycosylase [Bryobacterales bacterium]|nr:DNA-3-methyladenine glycosylase [Bryobacterales bacterium]